jgi:hypothetical protein
MIKLGKASGPLALVGLFFTALLLIEIVAPPVSGLASSAVGIVGAFVLGMRLSRVEQPEYPSWARFTSKRIAAAALTLLVWFGFVALTYYTLVVSQ